MLPRLIPYKNAIILLLDNSPANIFELPQCTQVFAKHSLNTATKLYACYKGSCTSCPFSDNDCYVASNNFFKTVNSPLKRLS